jgi:polyhydroxybutyrate depolymerase
MGRLPMAIAVIAMVTACGGSPASGPSGGPGGGTAGGPTSSAALVPGDHEQAMTVDGRRRTFLVHVPAGLPAARPIPVVIVLHGGGGDARTAIAQTGMSEQADRGGFLAVYPNGTGRLERSLLTWNSGTCCGYALEQQVNDVAFIATVIDELRRQYAGDPRRIFVTGMSNGGMLSYRLGCELADRIAAIAPVAGAMGVDCRPSAPISVVAFHGTADRQVPYRGGTAPGSADPHPRRDPPVADTIAFWAAHNHCTAASTQDVSGDTTREVRSCPGGVEVTLHTIDGGGHAWPGGPRGPAGADRPTSTISATELMWRFFEQHPKAA